MAILEYKAIATKVSYQDNGDVHATHACEGGQTVRIIYGGLAPLLAIVQTVKVDVLQIEDDVA